MEQDCVAGLYQSLGLSVGEEFSSEDVNLLYRKVFHVPSNTDEAHAAMKKIAGGDSSWSCAGEKVLDVLLEMEMEREKKEKVYWDLLLLNAGNLNQQSHPCTTDTDSSQRGRLVELHMSMRGVNRLKKAARQFWARLASEGVHSVLPSPWQGQSLRVKSQAWGCVSLSDALLLVEVKYDIMTHLLYTEMLEEHHTLSVWETLLPWQRHKEEEGLEDLAEEALESGDMLYLAALPGAFRIYRACLAASFRSSPESRQQSWSAASLLYELHTSRQCERNTLKLLGKGLDRQSLRLLCLYIRLATLRAQREKLSYSALLAARQSWETWPRVYSPCRAEQAALWLHGEEQEQNEDLISQTPQQAVLQLLVLIQEQERKYLLKLVQGVSVEDLQGPGCTVASQEDTQTQIVLRHGCIRRLRQIHTSLQANNETQTASEKTGSQPQPQHQMQALTCTKPEVWSQRQLEKCVLLLLTHLLELQEVQASTLLPVLLDERAQHLQGLREEYESELQAQRNSNLLQLLTSDAPLASGSTLIPHPNILENVSSEQKRAQLCSTGPVKAQNPSARPAEALAVVSVRAEETELNGAQAAGVIDKQDVCTGCGAVMEELPYLEILCVSDAASANLTAEGAAQEEGEGSERKSPQSYEKQGSLITLAWSKPPEGDAGGDMEAADGGTGQSQSEETPEESQVEKLKPALFHSGSTSPQAAEKQSSTDGELTSEERRVVDPPQKGEAALEATLQLLQPNLFFDPSEVEPRADDLCSGLTGETSEAGRDSDDVTAESELWDLRGPGPVHPVDLRYHTQATPGCDITEREAEQESTLIARERITEPVSAMERERTMRNLVDMQKKVEQRQQRDRERQLLRVQERLSIIQNRKAEEDLLGLKHTERLKHLTQDLPQEDKNQQKTVVRERLEQLRRERSYIMQSKRDRNTAGFKELLGPVALQSRDTEEETD